MADVGEREPEVPQVEKETVKDLEPDQAEDQKGGATVVCYGRGDA